jgi:hypothetical protein
VADLIAGVDQEEAEVAMEDHDLVTNQSEFEHLFISGKPLTKHNEIMIDNL